MSADAAIVRMRDRGADLAFAERRLREAMQEDFLHGGFSALHRMNERLEGDIARAHRAKLFREGWIA